MNLIEKQKNMKTILNNAKDNIGKGFNWIKKSKVWEVVKNTNHKLIKNLSEFTTKDWLLEYDRKTWKKNGDIIEYTSFDNYMSINTNKYESENKINIFKKRIQKRNEWEKIGNRIEFLEERLLNLEDEIDNPDKIWVAQEFYTNRLDDLRQKYKDWASKELEKIENENIRHENELKKKIKERQGTLKKQMISQNNKDTYRLEWEITKLDEKLLWLKKRNIIKRFWFLWIKEYKQYLLNKKTYNLSENINKAKREIWDKQENANSYIKFKEKQKKKKNNINEFLKNIEIKESFEFNVKFSKLNRIINNDLIDKIISTNKKINEIINWKFSIITDQRWNSMTKTGTINQVKDMLKLIEKWIESEIKNIRNSNQNSINIKNKIWILKNNIKDIKNIYENILWKVINEEKIEIEYIEKLNNKRQTIVEATENEWERIKYFKEKIEEEWYSLAA